MSQVGVRLAFREEGDYWNAYVAETGTLRGAILLGSIRMTVVSAHPAMRAMFMDMMKLAFGVALKIATGASVEKWSDEQLAPEHEKTKK